MSNKDEEGSGNAGWWKTRKTKSRFSVASHRPWKSPKPRFPHSHSPGECSRGKVEIQNQDSHFPTASPPFLSPKNQHKTKTCRLRRLQAHSWIRKWSDLSPSNAPAPNLYVSFPTPIEMGNRVSTKCTDFGGKI